MSGMSINSPEVRALDALCNRYGIKGTEKEIDEKIEKLAARDLRILQSVSGDSSPSAKDIKTIRVLNSNPKGVLAKLVNWLRRSSNYKNVEKGYKEGLVNKVDAVHKALSDKIKSLEEGKSNAKQRKVLDKNIAKYQKMLNKLDILKQVLTPDDTKEPQRDSSGDQLNTMPLEEKHAESQSSLVVKDSQGFVDDEENSDTITSPNKEDLVEGLKPEEKKPEVKQEPPLPLPPRDGELPSLGYFKWLADDDAKIEQFSSLNEDDLVEGLRSISEGKRQEAISKLSQEVKIKLFEQIKDNDELKSCVPPTVPKREAPHQPVEAPPPPPPPPPPGGGASAPLAGAPGARGVLSNAIRTREGRDQAVEVRTLLTTYINEKAIKHQVVMSYSLEELCELALSRSSIRRNIVVPQKEGEKGSLKDVLDARRSAIEETGEKEENPAEIRTYFEGRVKALKANLSDDTQNKEVNTEKVTRFLKEFRQVFDELQNMCNVIGEEKKKMDADSDNLSKIFQAEKQKYRNAFENVGNLHNLLVNHDADTFKSFVQDIATYRKVSPQIAERQQELPQDTVLASLPGWKKDALIEEAKDPASEIVKMTTLLKQLTDQKRVCTLHTQFLAQQIDAKDTVFVGLRAEWNKIDKAISDKTISIDKLKKELEGYNKAYTAFIRIQKDVFKISIDKPVDKQPAETEQRAAVDKAEQNIPKEIFDSTLYANLLEEYAKWQIAPIEKQETPRKACIALRKKHEALHPREASVSARGGAISLESLTACVAKVTERMEEKEEEEDWEDWEEEIEVNASQKQRSSSGSGSAALTGEDAPKDGARRKGRALPPQPKKPMTVAIFKGLSADKQVEAFTKLSLEDKKKYINEVSLDSLVGAFSSIDRVERLAVYKEIDDGKMHVVFHKIHSKDVKSAFLLIPEDKRQNALNHKEVTVERIKVLFEGCSKPEFWKLFAQLPEVKRTSVFIEGSVFLQNQLKDETSDVVSKFTLIPSELKGSCFLLLPDSEQLTGFSSLSDSNKENVFTSLVESQTISINDKSAMCDLLPFRAKQQGVRLLAEKMKDLDPKVRIAGIQSAVVDKALVIGSGKRRETIRKEIESLEFGTFSDYRKIVDACLSYKEKEALLSEIFKAKQDLMKLLFLAEVLVDQGSDQAVVCKALAKNIEKNEEERRACLAYLKDNKSSLSVALLNEEKLKKIVA